MEQIKIEEILAFGQQKYPFLQIQEINAKDLVYEERVRMSCFYCSRYGNNWRCPPHIPNVDYKKMLEEFDRTALVWVDMPFKKERYAEVRNESTNVLHRALLDLEKYVMSRGAEIPLSFIGGSCKLCKNGCGNEKCNNPYQSRTPMEATGINVVKSAAKYGIEIKFPVVDHIIRMGLLMW